MTALCFAATFFVAFSPTHLWQIFISEDWRAFALGSKTALSSANPNNRDIGNTYPPNESRNALPCEGKQAFPHPARQASKKSGHVQCDANTSGRGPVCQHCTTSWSFVKSHFCKSDGHILGLVGNKGPTSSLLCEAIGHLCCREAWGYRVDTDFV